MNPLDYMNRPQVEAYVRNLHHQARVRFLTGLAAGFLTGAVAAATVCTVAVMAAY